MTESFNHPGDTGQIKMKLDGKYLAVSSVTVRKVVVQRIRCRIYWKVLVLETLLTGWKWNPLWVCESRGGYINILSLGAGILCQYSEPFLAWTLFIFSPEGHITLSKAENNVAIYIFHTDIKTLCLYEVISGFFS